MDTVIRHLAINQVRSNGLICGKTYDDLTELETRVAYLPYNGYPHITEGKSTDNFTTYFIRPIVYLKPCSECLNIYRV